MTEAEAHALDVALESIALGEASPEQAGKVIAPMLGALNLAAAEAIYAALRAWTWKALEARRRDSDLSGWADLIGMVAARFEGGYNSLALKLDAFVELLHPSIVMGAIPTPENPLARKHVPEILKLVFHAGGRLPKQSLMNATGLKEANVTRVMSGLIDQGWFQREAMGREANYRLTERGRDIALKMFSDWSAMQIQDPIEKKEKIELANVASQARIDAWGHLSRSSQVRTGPPNYTAVVGIGFGVTEPKREPIVRYANTLAKALQVEGNQP